MIDHMSDEQLDATLHQTLSDAERESIERHLAQCPMCRARHDERESLRRYIQRSLALDLKAAQPSPQMTYTTIAPRMAREKAKMNTLQLRRRLTFTVAGTVLVSALMLTLFYPGGIAAAAQQFFEVIRSITLGEYSRAMQVVPAETTGDHSLGPDQWVLRTEIGNFAGNAAPGVEPIVRSVPSLEEAQAIAGFPILTPAYLPDGYALREVKLAPIGGTHWVFMFYSGPAHDIIVVQMPGGPQPNDDPNVFSSVTAGVITDGTLEKTDLAGRTAVWIEGHSLMWAVDNMTYEVGGLDLTFEEAKQIARSLR